MLLAEFWASEHSCGHGLSTEAHIGNGLRESAQHDTGPRAGREKDSVMDR